MKNYKINNKYIKVELQEKEGIISENYYTRSEGKDIKVLTSSSTFGSLSLSCEADDGTHKNVLLDYATMANEMMKSFKEQNDIRKEAPGPPAETDTLPMVDIKLIDIQVLTFDEYDELCIKGAVNLDLIIEKHIKLGHENKYVEVEATITTKGAYTVERFEDKFYSALVGMPDFTWINHAKYQQDNHSPDWTWRSPAAIYQKGNDYAAIIPEIDYFLENETFYHTNAALDMDIREEGKRYISLGLTPSAPHGHASYRHIAGTRFALDNTSLGYAYTLLLGSDAQDLKAYKPVEKFLWHRYAQPRVYKGHAVQKHSFEKWTENTWNEFADRVWMEFEYNGQACGTLQCPNWDIKGDAWFSAWWNNMRSAYGMALYGRRIGDNKFYDRGKKILNLALSAPRTNGAFPAFFITNENGTYWMKDHEFGGVKDYFHHIDMAWTSYWMLKWYNDFEQSDEILSRCKEYAELILKMQDESGFLPSFFDENMALRPDTRLNEESAEPVVPALYLLELYKTVEDERYLISAVKMMDYLQKNIIPENKWFDFETFYSCAPKPNDFYDKFTGQQPQCTLAMLYVPKVYLQLYKILGEQKYLELGCDVLDYLSMFQQVWSHPRLTPNLIGGFTSQNTDAEWSDARQTICAPIYMDYYKVTGRKDYMERGVAAIRAGFAIAPAENWAHVGFIDFTGATSGIHWGQGSGVVSTEMFRNKFGDIYVDQERQWGIGINGCAVTKLNFTVNAIELDIKTDLTFDEPLLLKIDQPASKQCRIIFNGKDMGDFTADALESGIDVEV